ncbi:hypothetical protein BB559_002778 [Furculomyces boomerangus]|uniref:Profilin n=2 Tax=Harpellales TaxID=61421 RepID=A0A2T9Y918_9FUNG|nr:hypothetical protein BB559_005364 [Furculomyces boomerangus]PVU95305.1 hypothetical protein BB559_002778 [Furculomyces boomerangus]PVZ98585.1 hypothetical protein BB558_005412 [Smittium angustum]
MSWQAYVDNNLVGTGYLKLGAIHGLDGSTWATSPGFTVNPTEIQELIKSFSDPSPIRQHGLYVSGVKYFALNCNERSIYGKKESTGVICVKTKTCILIGVYGEETQPGQATTVVEKLADYLIGVGY